MRTYLGIFALALTFVSHTFAQSSAKFEVVTIVESSPLKDQQSSGTCWSFATTSFIETEAIRLGKETVVLSPMYYVAPTYRKKAEKFIERKGKSYFDAGDLTFSVLDAYQESGAVPESVYNGIIEGDWQHDHLEMDNLLAAMVKSVGASGYGRIKPDSWRKSRDGVLHAYLGDPPDHFIYTGKRHTPRSFASKFVGINVDDYVEITSFLHHDFFERCILDIPANWNKEPYLNLPIQEFEQVILAALKNGFSLAWDGDVSEPGFDFESGVMKLSVAQENSVITQSIRQAAFDDKTTTDDHNMHIVGIAKDPQGKTFFVMKNSEGDNESGGYVYMSSNALLLKTISLLVHRDAIPAGIKSMTYLDNSAVFVPYLDKTPVLDGKLDGDERLTRLPERKFNHVLTFDNECTEPASVTYRLGYTPTHLYVYLESDAERITYRNRGFVNGDGFKVLLALPQQGELTSEYYDIGFSPSLDKSCRGRKLVWSYNHKPRHNKSLSSATEFAVHSASGKCGFEALIAWSDIPPYHPWFTEDMGFNLYFAKGIKDGNAHGYAEVKDEGIFDEELPARGFRKLAFERARPGKRGFWMIQPRNRNLTVGSPLLLQVATLSSGLSSELVDVEISAENGRVKGHQAVVARHNGLSRKSVSVDTQDLKEGVYKLVVRSNRSILVDSQIVVFPKIAYKSLRAELEEKAKPGNGAAQTLMFKINELEKDLGELKPYESGVELIIRYQVFKREYDSFLSGVDPYRDLIGPYRRAFKSKHDQSYQPYTIKLPENYDRTKKYPLLVFLHGSGRDERGLLNGLRSGGNFIELAPLARDIYRAYSSDESQKDIVEAINDVAMHFAVDKENIVIGGVSMGGYGALRTFYEHPELYRGVAVFSGHPHLASDWLEGIHPNFLETEYLKCFPSVPVFVFHGRKDGAIPVKKAEDMIDKLTGANAVVTQRIVEDKGHEPPDDETNTIYWAWLNQLVDQK